MTKYTPLEHYLRQFALNRITLTFDQTETILGSRLPASSHAYEAHWRGTTPGRPGGAIAAAGWKVDKIDWLACAITLSRSRPARNSGRTAAAIAHPSDHPILEPVPWQTLEAKAAKYFSRLWETNLGPRTVNVGGVPKSFDLVSADGHFVGDAKQYKNIATPSAKWQGIAECVWLLQHVQAEHRFLVFGGDAVVAERFLVRWRRLAAPVQFYHLTEDGHRPL